MLPLACLLVITLNFTWSGSSPITDGLLSVEDYKNKASAFLNSFKMNYVYHGAFEDITLALNTKAFARIRIKPKYLVDVSRINTSTRVLGTTADWPVGVSPVARQKDFHPQGEIAAARGAGKSKSIYILSSFSQTLLEDVADAAPETEKWFQMYLNKNQTINNMFIKRVEKAGFKAIVITIDDPVSSVVRNLYYQQFSKLYPTVFPNYLCMGLEVNNYTAGFSSNVDDLRKLVKKTRLPVIVKGILTGAGAALVSDSNANFSLIYEYS